MTINGSGTPNRRCHHLRVGQIDRHDPVRAPGPAPLDPAEQAPSGPGKPGEVARRPRRCPGRRRRPGHDRAGRGRGRPGCPCRPSRGRGLRTGRPARLASRCERTVRPIAAEPDAPRTRQCGRVRGGCRVGPRVAGGPVAARIGRAVRAARGPRRRTATAAEGSAADRRPPRPAPGRSGSRPDAPRVGQAGRPASEHGDRRGRARRARSRFATSASRTHRSTAGRATPAAGCLRSD